MTLQGKGKSFRVKDRGAYDEDIANMHHHEDHMTQGFCFSFILFILFFVFFFFFLIFNNDLCFECPCIVSCLV